MIDPTYQRFSLFLLLSNSPSSSLLCHTPIHTHTLHITLICNVPSPSHTRIKPHRSLPISLSGNHFTRGNPKHGCGGISLWYVLAFVRNLACKVPRCFTSLLDWRIAKVGVASDTVCVCIAILYSDHCRHLIDFRGIYLPSFPFSLLLFFFFFFFILLTLPLHLPHYSDLALPDLLSIYLSVHKTTYSPPAMDQMYMTPTSDYCASPIAFPNVPELLSCSFDDVSTDPSPSPPMVSVAKLSIH